MARIRLTKRVVDEAEPAQGEGGELREVKLWDSDVRGFFLRVLPSGSKVYAVSYGTGRRGVVRRVTIGEHGAPWTPDPVTGEQRTLTCELARQEAERLRGEVRAGGDPGAKRVSERALPTLAQFAERYLTDYAGPHKRPATVAADRGLLGLREKPRRRFKAQPKPRTILAALGSRRVDRISTSEVTRLHLAWKDTPTRANRALALLSHIFAMAEKWGVRPRGTNPCRGIDRFDEKRRERFLSGEELARLGAALGFAEKAAAKDKSQEDGAESLFAVAAIRLLILTGCRMSEILTAKWEAVDLDTGILTIAEPKEGRPKAVVLNAPAAKVLSDLPQLKSNPFVIVGHVRGRHLTDLEHPWQRIRKRAGLEDVRLHDLRHSFASVAVAGGATLPIIGALLGHSQPATTARYAHLSDDPLRAASKVIGERIASAMKRKPAKDNRAELRRGAR
jgi:integrase